MRGFRSTIAMASAITAVVALVAPGGAGAFEAFDGRLQVHGFYESQFRTISADFSEDWDVTQWYQVLNIEVELDIVEDGYGWLDLLSAYVRWEGRYDCIYSRGCGLFRSINAYGDRAKSLPRRLDNADELTSAGVLIVANAGRFSGDNTDPVPLSLVSGFKGLAETPKQTFATADDPIEMIDIGDECVAGTPNCLQAPNTPFESVFENFNDWRFTQITGKGGANDGNPILILGPWLPKNKNIHTLAALADRVNPFDSSRFNPTLYKLAQVFERDPTLFDADNFGAPGGGANPYRPIPIRNEGGAGIGTVNSRGLYLPNPGLRQELSEHDIKTLPLNFTENQRAFNRGANQQQTKELKEAYLDIETLDSRLWLRVGKQNIVWGKTELFRTTDQFNPVDLALASLPSLEESRFPLWAVRGVYSLYEIGPLEDVRVEVAFNFDEITPNDLGACGEPYTFDLVCQAAFGGFAHSVTGVGLAGVVFPQNPWESFEGWEIGGRIEWRWDRFSFALSDFWGYNDLPTIRRISTYERNVDPNTGRPRTFGARGPCTTQDPVTFSQHINGGRGPDLRIPVDQDCLRPAVTDRRTFLVNLAAPNEFTPVWVTCDPDELGQATIDGGTGPCRANNQLPPFGPQDDLRGQTAGYNEGRGLREIVVDPRVPGAAAVPNTVDPATGFPVVDQIWRRNPDTGQYEAIRNQAYVPNNSLENHHANTQLFAWVCSNTVGFSTIDRRSCALNVFGSTLEIGGFAISRVIGGVLAGTPTANSLVVANAIDARLPPMPVVLLQRDFNDTDTFGCVDPDQPSIPCGAGGNTSGFASDLANRLSAEQEALLGCGPFWGTNCDFSGIDLLNADASVLLQSVVGMEGAREAFSQFRQNLVDAGVDLNDPDLNFGPWRADGYFSPINRYNAGRPLAERYTGPLLAQPGTLPYDVGGFPGPRCTTDDIGGERGRLLPGCANRWLNLARTEQNPLWQEISNNSNTPNPFGNGRVFAGIDGNPDPVGVCLNSLQQSPDCPRNPAQSQRNQYPFFNGFSGKVFLGTGVENENAGIGTPRPTPIVGGAGANNRGAGHPLTNQPFASELSALSFNFAQLLVTNSEQFTDGMWSVFKFCTENPTSIRCPGGGNASGINGPFNQNYFRFSYTAGGDEDYTFGPNFDDPDFPNGVPFYETDNDDPVPGRFLPEDHCSYVTPQFCETVQDIFGVAGVRRNVARAGGNSRFGRRTMVWHSGGSVLIEAEKRNVLGFSADFAEDVTKSNWSMEFTWIPDQAFGDTNAYDNISRSDVLNMTLSVDRPTFINFLNANRTFFINSQWFIQYVPDYKSSFGSNGAWNVLFTLFAQTGYFQDRLLPSMTFVYDVMSNSGAFLPQISYRFSENFSLSIGALAFWGRRQLIDMPLNEIGPTSNRSGPFAYQDSTENGLSLLRNRDEIFARLRYTF